MHHHRLIELRREISFVGRPKIAAPLEFCFQHALGVAFLQILHCVVVTDAGKRRLNLFELGKVAANGLQVHTPPLQAALHDETDQSLRQIHQVIEFGISNFRFDHPELGEVTARLRFLRAKRWTKRIHFAQRHRRGFDVKLAGLREVRLLVEIIDGEECARAFASRRSENRRIGERESSLVETIAHRFDNLRTHPQNRSLPLRPHPKMPVLHQEICAVLLRRNGVGIGLRHALHHLHVRHIEFVAARRALIGANLAFDDHARFLCQRLDRLEHLWRDRILRHYSLNHARAVAKLRKQQLPALAQVIEPAAQSDRLPFMLPDFRDGSYR